MPGPGQSPPHQHWCARKTQKHQSERDSLPLLLQHLLTLLHKYFFTCLSLSSVVSICCFVPQLKEEQEGGAEGLQRWQWVLSLNGSTTHQQHQLQGSCTHRNPSGLTVGPKLSLCQQQVRASSPARKAYRLVWFILNSLTKFLPHIRVATLPLPRANSSGSMLFLRPRSDIAWESGC